MTQKEKEADAVNIDAAQEVSQAQDTTHKVSKQEKAAKSKTEMFSVPAAFSSPVSITEVLDEIVELLQSHVVIQPEDRDLTALWTVFTYGVPLFRHSPRLLATSPVMQCGKTTFFEILSELVYKGFHISNLTSASLFRVIDKFNPTVLADEADTYIYENEQLRNVVNQGHSKAGSRVMRTGEAGKGFDLQFFETYGALAIGQIGWPPDTILDRCIPILMKRKLPHERITAFNPADPAVKAKCQELQSKIIRWVSDHKNLLETLDPSLPPCLTNRTADKLRPLFAIVSFASQEWQKRTEEAAMKMLRHFDLNDPSLEIQLLHDLEDFMVGRGRYEFSSVELVAHLSSLSDRPWPTCLLGKAINARKMSNLLRPFGIRSKNIRLPSGQVKGYDLHDFDEAFERYLS